MRQLGSLRDRKPVLHLTNLCSFGILGRFFGGDKKEKEQPKNQVPVTRVFKGKREFKQEPQVLIEESTTVDELKKDVQEEEMFKPRIEARDERIQTLDQALAHPEQAVVSAAKQ